MRFSADVQLRAAKDVHARDFDGEFVLLDLQRGRYFGLDEVGALFWQGIVAQKTFPQIVRELACVYEVSEETLLADLLDLAESLADRGLLVEVGAP